MLYIDIYYFENECFNNKPKFYITNNYICEEFQLNKYQQINNDDSRAKRIGVDF